MSRESAHLISFHGMQSDLFPSSRGQQVHRSTGIRTGRAARAATRQASYVPLPSVWEGEDAELLEQLIEFYPRRRPQRILDATVNGGRFWRGSTRPVIGLDIESAHRPSITGDNTRMPFPDALFDVVVYDPPTFPTRERTSRRTSTPVLAWAFVLPRRTATAFPTLIRPSSRRRIAF